MTLLIEKHLDITSWGWFVVSKNGASYGYCYTKLGAYFLAKRIIKNASRQAKEISEHSTVTELYHQ